MYLLSLLGLLPLTSILACGGDKEDTGDAAVDVADTTDTTDTDTTDTDTTDTDTTDTDTTDTDTDPDPEDVDDDGDGMTENEGDCDDTDGSIYDGADEVPDDGIDQDCDGADLETAVEDSLYDLLGGETGVNAVLDEFLVNVVADSNINWMFANADTANLKIQLHDQICEVAGGGCIYMGADMVSAHAGMGITDAQFDSMVGDLLTALDTLAVPYTSPNFDGGEPADSLILALAGMQGDIVEDPAGTDVYFNQLGGHATLHAVVNDFIGNVVANPEINTFFASTDAVVLENLLVEQICEATGGYCTYTGADMVSAHAGMCISTDHFNSMVGNLLTTFDSLGVPYTANTYDGGALADDLILVLAGMHDDIVEDPENDGCTPTPASVTWTGDVEAILDANGCMGCHGSSGGLTITYADIVGVVDSGTGLAQIEPGNPDASYLWHKINGTQASVSGGSGVTMPKNMPAMSASDLAIVETWILEGAVE
jgi:hemoglobin